MKRMTKHLEFFFAGVQTFLMMLWEAGKFALGIALIVAPIMAIISGIFSKWVDGVIIGGYIVIICYLIGRYDARIDDEDDY